MGDELPQLREDGRVDSSSVATLLLGYLPVGNVPIVTAAEEDLAVLPNDSLDAGNSVGVLLLFVALE